MKQNPFPQGRGVIGWRGTLDLVVPYIRHRLGEQLRAIAFIISYLIIFQLVVLKLPIAEVGTISGGLALVVLGLAFFMEGIKIGLMPLGESLGLKLPRHSPMIGMLTFAFILGVGATFAEPAIGVLRTAGATVKAWEAPLLFFLLNTKAQQLVYSIGIGVGVAVILGMLRFLYNWSLKPMLLILVPILLVLSLLSVWDANLHHLLGLAWDSGAVTTGPVTVPLVLALGIGISRVVGGHTEEGTTSGFGVVTLASLTPIIAVLSLGFYYKSQVPGPMSELAFFSKSQQSQSLKVFENEQHMFSYALRAASQDALQTLHGGDFAQFSAWMKQVYEDPKTRAASFGIERSEQEILEWLLIKGSQDLQLAVFGSKDQVREAGSNLAGTAKATNTLSFQDRLLQSFRGAVQAILPLTAFLLIVFILFLRERLPQADEIVLGISFALIGMTIFFLGIDLGLSKLGNQVGGHLPAAYTTIDLPDKATEIENFDLSLLRSATRNDGQLEQFFYVARDHGYDAITYHANAYDSFTGKYSFVPSHGPIFTGDLGLTGLLVVIIFAFFMGYGATLAEPALNAMGSTVEDLTIGTFKKSVLIQSVAIGVGIGIAIGVAKIIWNLPLFWMLAPPYLVLLGLTAISSEQFVNIAWDSAGVTTGPVTVPLVLALGMGIGQQSGVIEGFGILAMASVSPILAVLLIGLRVNRRQRQILDG